MNFKISNSQNLYLIKNFKFKIEIFFRTIFKYPLFFVISLSFLPVLPLLRFGMFSADDSQSHVARLASFYQSLSEGNIIPRWAENLNNGFGHPVLMFLYPLTNYLGSFWHLLGFSFVDSTKITFGFSFVLAGVFMYLFIKELFDAKTAFVAAFLYQFAPYRFVDFYSRAALGEHLAFLTMPLVLWSFTRMIKSNRAFDIAFSSLSLACLLLSHNAIALMFLPFFFLYLIIAILFLSHKSYVLRRISISLFLGFGLSAFFWLPAFFEGKYTLRDVLTNKEYAQRFPGLLEFFYTPLKDRIPGYLTKEVGWAQWLAVLGGLIYLIRSFVIPNLIRDPDSGQARMTSKKMLKQVQHDSKTEASLFIFWFISLAEIFFWLSFFLLNKVSLPLWHLITILQKFQFPWRFLSLGVLTSSFLGVSLLLVFKKKSYQIMVITIIIFITVIETFPFWQPRGYLKETDYYFIHNYSGTTDTGESSPIWSIRGMEIWPKAPLEIIDGAGKLTEISRISTLHSYQVDLTKASRLVDNTVYFPGWEVLVDNNPTTIQFQDPNYRGLITFNVPQGKHTVIVSFGETKLRLLSDYLSLAGFVVLFGILLVPYVIRRFSHF